MIQSIFKWFRWGSHDAPVTSWQLADMRVTQLSMNKDIRRMAAILDGIARDWPTLRDAITTKLKDDADKIEALTTELANTNVDDPRAEQIDNEIQAVLKSLKGTVETAPAPTPTVADDHTGTAPTPPVTDAPIASDPSAPETVSKDKPVADPAIAGNTPTAPSPF